MRFPDTSSGSDPSLKLRPRLVAALLELAELIRGCAEEPGTWKTVPPRIHEVAGEIKERHLSALSRLERLLREKAGTDRTDPNLPVSARLRGLVLLDGDVYYRLASLLPDSLAPFASFEPARIHAVRTLCSILESTVHAAMRSRLAFAQTKLSGDTLRSCVEHLSEGVLCFSRKGHCVFVNAEALRALSLPETSSTADVDSWIRRSPLNRPLVERFRRDPLPKEPRWLPPITAEVTGKSLRLVALAVPPARGEDAPPVFHVFVVQPDEARELPAAGLSEREAAIVRLVVRGATYGEAATELGIGEESVRTYAKRAFSKLDVRNREELLKLMMGRPRGPSS